MNTRAAVRNAALPACLRAALLLLAAPCFLAAATDAEEYARKAAEQWVALIDAGKHPESWKAAAESFQAAVSQKQWVDQVRAARRQYGKLVSRRLLDAQYTRKLPGAVDAEYVVLQFEAAFAGTETAAIETITSMLEKDGQWKVFGYWIRNLSCQPVETQGTNGFTNSLGMKFITVPGTRLLMCVHETRNKDYARFAAATPDTDGSWKAASGGDNHPVVNVSWDDAQAFCIWLGKKEGHAYRLPTDHEWSAAAGIGDREDKNQFPEFLHEKIPDVFPWGMIWPPPANAGNFADRRFKEMFPDKLFIESYTDGFPTTAPVMSFAPNKTGFHDLSGNVWEWCEDAFVSQPIRPQDTQAPPKPGDVQLYTRTFEVPPDFMTRHQSANRKPTARDILGREGILFPENSSAVFNASTCRLIVRNTQINLNLIESYTKNLALISENRSGEGAREEHVLRGGAWSESARNRLLASFRHHLAHGSRADAVGFRCVVEAVQ